MNTKRNLVANATPYQYIVDFFNDFGAVKRNGEAYTRQSFQNGFCRLADGRTVIFPHFDTVGEWKNRLESGGEFVVEYRAGGQAATTRRRGKNWKNEWRKDEDGRRRGFPPRVLILGKMGIDDWRFLGEFELFASGVDENPAWRKWKRVSATVETLR